ncbi:MAG: sensor histidine kinase [Opitutales bacterium]
MAPNRPNALDRILGRLDDLDATNLTSLVQRLARERRLLESVFNTIQDGILVIDARGTVHYANQASHAMIGLKPDDVGTAILWKIIPDLLRSLDHDPEELEGERDNRTVLTREMEIHYPESRFVRFYMVPIRAPLDGHTEESGFVVVLGDITQEKTSTEARIESERIASVVNLAAGVAHELGNPINSLGIHLQLIQRKVSRLADSPDSEKIRKSLEICQSELSRLDGIIEDFLQAVRPQPPDLIRLEPLQVVEEVVELLEGELTELNIELTVSVDKNPPSMLGDRNQIKQVLINLIQNAMEAIPAEKKGRIHVRFQSNAESLFIQIRDNGVGISEADLAKVFQPYFTTKHEGHGLGMMIVQRIVRDHGGQIGVDSREGEGTSITLQFPVQFRRARLLQDR